MGQPFKSSSQVAGETLMVQLIGDLAEGAVLPEISSEPKMNINVGKITKLNSYGTRLWCIWVNKFKEPVHIYLEECPVIFVKSFSMVKGFLPENMEVLSFYIPFYSDATGERQDFLALKGKHFFEGGKLDIPQLKDSKGNSMEMDIIPSSYLAFLNE